MIAYFPTALPLGYAVNFWTYVSVTGEKQYLSVVLVDLSLFVSGAEHSFIWLSHLHSFHSVNCIFSLFLNRIVSVFILYF